MIICYYTSKYVGWLIVFNQIVPAIGLCERNDILSVRELLGLKNVKTSKIYTQVLNRGSNADHSPHTVGPPLCLT